MCSKIVSLLKAFAARGTELVLCIERVDNRITNSKVAVADALNAMQFA